MDTKTKQKVRNYALQSRILVLFLQAIFNILIPNFDAKVFNPPVVHSTNVADWLVDVLFSGFRRWDGVYFLHIAEYGYTYENTLAFFPAFPLTVIVFANSIFYPLQFIIHYGNVLLISSFVLNLFCFVLATKYLSDLTLSVMCDEVLAMKVVQLFCINPASIFFSAAYSEALFAMFTFMGMLKLEHGKFYTAALVFGCSGATRSNGLINLAFILYKQALFSIYGISSMTSQKNKSMSTKIFGVTKILVTTLLRTVICTVIVALPFILYQFYSYLTFCNNAVPSDLPDHILNYGNERGYKMAHTGPSPWCGHSPPISYSYVQNTHWNVGFMTYYEFKQIPNFLLAMPVVVTGLAALAFYARHNFITFATLGLNSVLFHRDSKKSDEAVAPSHVLNSHGFYSHHVYVYLIHLIALVTFGMLFMHVQVLTRFVCSSCPLFYFFLAWMTVPTDQLKASRYNAQELEVTQNGSTSRPANENMQIFSGFMEWEDNWANKAIYIYFDLYFFVGIAAFVNFLPFT